MEEDVQHSHFDDLERFMSHWQDDPQACCNFVGRAIGRIGYRNLKDLFFSIGVSYFAHQSLPDRIDFLYDHHGSRIGGVKGETISRMVEIKLIDDAVCLYDRIGRHGKVQVMLLRDVIDGHRTYSLRYFVTADQPCGYLLEHWNQRTRGRPTFDRVAATLFHSGLPSTYAEEYEFWNFRRGKEWTEGVIVYPEARGFFDVVESKSVADLVVLASNLVGFRC